MLCKDQASRNADNEPGAKSLSPRVTLLRQFFNILGCALALPIYYLQTAHTRYPITLDILVTIALTELNRFVVEGRRMTFSARGREQHCEIQEFREKDGWDGIHVESQPLAPRLECLAAVVGWREDPALYARALESYKSARTCTFVLAGIDGDEAEDEDMVKIFSKVRNFFLRFYSLATMVSGNGY